MEITKEEYYRRLKCAELKLDMLEAGGVDNWDWYGDSLNPDGEQSYSDLRDELKAEILGG
ncbi:hypothetical protein AB1L88_05990 [Tautonia sp. JC769]|uniref:hypothetical protein n=1 Tax=Tautonia sp. JC769 TaxID=3232135 RepID=UPI00345967E2